VETRQIAATILNVLGINPKELERRAQGKQQGIAWPLRSSRTPTPCRTNDYAGRCGGEGEGGSAPHIAQAGTDIDRRCWPNRRANGGPEAGAFSLAWPRGVCPRRHRRFRSFSDRPQRAAEALERGRLEMRLAPSQLVSLRTCSKIEASRSSCSANTTRTRSTPPEPEVGTLAACLASAALLRSSCARATL
jgi:hypothetical protein